MADVVRVQDLLAEARRALALRDRIAVTGDDPAEVDEALRGLYLDLGRALVAAVEAGERVVFDLGAAAGDLVGGPHPRSHGELDLAASGFSLLESAEGLQLDPYDDSTPVIPPEREFTAEEPADYVITTLADLRAASGSGSSSFEAFRGGEVPWRKALADLLALLALPRNFADASELAVESSRLQWATGDLVGRLGPFPDDIRLALTALLAARAHHLRGRLDSDVGPRLSLDRLRRYRLDSDLPAVAGLAPTPRPESGSWEGDARQWWSLLAGEDG